MAILRFTASADSTITDSYKPGLTIRGTGSNTGAADTAEVFSIYGQTSGSSGIGTSVERSRALFTFPVNDIIAKRTAGTLPASGSVNFYLKLSNAVHGNSLPKDYVLAILPVSRSWNEGRGLDLDEYSNLGVVNWEYASTDEIFASASLTFGDVSISNGAKLYLTGSSVDSPHTFTINTGIGTSTKTDIALNGSINTTAKLATELSRSVELARLDATIALDIQPSINSSNSSRVDLVQKVGGFAGNTTVQGTVVDDTVSVTTVQFTGGDDNTPWNAEGGDFKTQMPAVIYTQQLDGGEEDVSIDISEMVEQWIIGSGPSAAGSLKFNDASIADGTTLILTGSNPLTPLTLTFDTSTATSTATVIGGNGASSASTVATRVQEAIAAAKAAGTTVNITATVNGSDNTKVDLVQDGAGSVGNTIIQGTLVDDTTSVTTTQFRGGGLANYGLVMKMSGSFEDGTRTQSYYTKKFFTRKSQYFYKRPSIEARWDSSTGDDRSYFYTSSSLAPAADNLNNVYLFNHVRGQLTDIPNLGADNKVFVSLFTSSAGSIATGGHAVHLPVGGGVQKALGQLVTGSRVSTGIYSASFAYTGSSRLYDVWRTGSAAQVNAGTAGFSAVFHTGTIEPKQFGAGNVNSSNYESPYVTAVPGFRPSYTNMGTERFRVTARKRFWNPNIYSVANQATSEEIEIVRNGFYKIYRVSDDYVVVPYGTGSINHTKLSYDRDGNYFDLDMSLFEQDFAYAVKFVYYVNGNYHEQPEVFKFRVEAV